jgi:RimJ/RimL family protein N-acetyltransferase
MIATRLEGKRLVLEPLRVEHAQEMVVILDDQALHTFTGGQPDTIDQLRRRFQRQVVGHSSDGSETWLNWVLRRGDDAVAVGFVQATVTGQADRLQAEVAWVISTAQQGRGLAKEAAGVMVDWLREQGVDVVVAHIHPDHRASAAVAESIGLTATGEMLDGEVRWTG